ncbi:hypothetical protein GCM10020256_13120 [Streptomyces thermocoprophilus]
MVALDRHPPTPERSELDALKQAIEDAGVRLTGLNFYAGQLPGPDRGALSVPGEESERFRANIDVAADFAASLGCTALNALYGNRVEGVDPAEQDALALENLVLAARAAEPDRRDPADRGAEQARVSAVPAGERTGRGRRRGPGQRGDRPRQRQVPDGPVPPVHERRGPAGRDRRVRREDRPRPDRRQPGPRRAGHRLPSPGGPPRPAPQGRYDGWVGLEYKPGDRPSADAFDWLPAGLRAAR